MKSPPLECDLSPEAVNFLRSSEAANAAILMYDRADRVVWANHAQMQLAPVSDYENETHSSLFWKMLSAGLISNRYANEKPAEWLEKAKVSRRINDSLNWFSECASFRMLATNRIFEDDVLIQARVKLDVLGVERYIGTKEFPMDMVSIISNQKNMELMTSALDSFDIAICLIGSDKVPIHSNESFKELMTKGDILSFDKYPFISAVKDADNAVIQEKIELALLNRNYQSIFPLSSFHGTQLASLSSGNVPGTAVLVVSRFGEDEDHIVKALENALGLSPVEAQVALLVGTGMSPEQIAKQRSRSIDTIYTQIRNIKSKLKGANFFIRDISSLASLVVKLSAIAGVTNSRKARGKSDE